MIDLPGPKNLDRTSSHTVSTSEKKYESLDSDLHEIEVLHKRNDTLRGKLEDLEEDNDFLRRRIKKLETDNAALRDNLAMKQAEFKESLAEGNLMPQWRDGRLPERDLINQKILQEMDDKAHHVALESEQQDEEKDMSAYDAEWDYNLTMGHLVKRKVRVPKSDGDFEKPVALWFPDLRGTKMRKVFVGFKVKRISKVDPTKGTFCVRFHIYFTWLMSEHEFISFKRAEHAGDPREILDWKPEWIPLLEFQNIVEGKVDWHRYPEHGTFRMKKYKDFGHPKNVTRPSHLYDSKKARFIRAKLEVDATFAEELELQNYPVDCQDLAIVLHERSTQGCRVCFVPELREYCFGSIDPRFSVIDDWDLRSAIVEFGDVDRSRSRTSALYTMMTIRLKIQRRSSITVWNMIVVPMVLSILSLAAYQIPIHGKDSQTNFGERLKLFLFILLATIGFSYSQYIRMPRLPYLTIMDKYILTIYILVASSMAESAILKSVFKENAEQVDRYAFWASVGSFFFAQIFFLYYGFTKRWQEEKKLGYSSDAVAYHVETVRPPLKFDYRKRETMPGGKIAFTTLKPEQAKLLEQESESHSVDLHALPARAVSQSLQHDNEHRQANLEEKRRKQQQAKRRPPFTMQAVPERDRRDTDSTYSTRNTHESERPLVDEDMGGYELSSVSTKSESGGYKE